MIRVGIRPMTPADWPAVEHIYREGIATGHATFEAEPPDWDGFDSGKLPDLRLVATDTDGLVVGWAAASPVSSRPVYRGVVEHSSYIADAAREQGAQTQHGIGRKKYGQAGAKPRHNHRDGDRLAQPLAVGVAARRQRKEYLGQREKGQ